MVAFIGSAAAEEEEKEEEWICVADR